MPVEPGNEEQMADRLAVASGEDVRKHEETRVRDVHIGKKKIGDSELKNNLTD